MPSLTYKDRTIRYSAYKEKDEGIQPEWGTRYGDGELSHGNGGASGGHDAGEDLD